MPCVGFRPAPRGTDEEINKAVEAGKKDFAGIELPGRTLAVIGLGAIGRLVANAAAGWACASSASTRVDGRRRLAARAGDRQGDISSGGLHGADFVSVHVPLVAGHPRVDQLGTLWPCFGRAASC
jgi:D-3-phosphoglycerate dehydrogenase